MSECRNESSYYEVHNEREVFLLSFKKSRLLGECRKGAFNYDDPMVTW